MACWKVAPAFLRPKGIFQYANVPHGQMNVVLCWCSGLIWIWLYLEKLSMKEKASQPAHSSMIWSMNSVGKLSLGHALFKSQKSVHTRIVPCFLLTGTRFDTHWVKWIGYINLNFSNFSTSTLMVVAFLGLTRWSFYRTGLASGYIMISCSTIFGSKPSISS